jgi:hypothetical protein
MSYFTLASTDLPACWRTGSMPEDSVSAAATSLRAAFLCFFHLSRLHSKINKAQSLPKEEFKREVERHLTGRETEAWELLYFKLFKRPSKGN